MDHQTQFPKFPAGAYPALPPGFRDSSWINDGQPSMTSDELRLHIWVDHPDNPYGNVDADDPAFARYGVTPLDADGCPAQDEPILQTDDWAQVLALIETRNLERSK